MADVFISYHEKTAGQLAQQIADALEGVGISCWYAKRNMPPGGDFAREIPPQINKCRLFLLILNDDVIYQSQHIENEVGLAFSRRNKRGDIIILPLEIGNFIRKDWADYYLVHTQSLKIALLDNANTKELTRKIADSLEKTPKKQETPDPPPKSTTQPVTSKPTSATRPVTTKPRSQQQTMSTKEQWTVNFSGSFACWYALCKSTEVDAG